MRLLFQILAHNNEAQIGDVLAELPRDLDGITETELLVIDDGSTDATRQVAQARGAHHVIRLPRARGKAGAFMMGLETCLDLGADLIVNVDLAAGAPLSEVSRLIEPLVRLEADVVVGRPCGRGELLGLGREAAGAIHILGRRFYAAEVRWQARFLGLAITEIKLAEGKDHPRAALDSLSAGALTTLTYRPLPVFGAAALIFFVVGIFTSSAASLSTGVMLGACGGVAHLLAANLRRMEKLQGRLLRMADTLPMGEEPWDGEPSSNELLTRYEPPREIH